MTTAEIAHRLVALCREQKWEAAQRELYADDAVSIEPEETPMTPKVTTGIEGILAKGRAFVAMVDTMHALTISEPLIAGQSFACTMALDVTFKGQPRMQMAELCVYDVKESKIVSEQFHA